MLGHRRVDVRSLAGHKTSGFIVDPILIGESLDDDDADVALFIQLILVPKFVSWRRLKCFSPFILVSKGT